MKSSKRILHILSQRPSLTGSGIYLEAIIRQAAESGFEQCAVIGVPAGDRRTSLGGLAPQTIHPVYFQTHEQDPAPLVSAPRDLNFPVPGMSDVMPYTSTVWSNMSHKQLQSYRDVWSRHLIRVIDQFQPDLIQSNHLWLVTSLLKDLAGNIPVGATCHATGLRQMTLCPHLKEEVLAGCRQLDHICVLHQNHCTEVMETLGVPQGKITVTGVGFRDDIFNKEVLATNDPNRSNNILYAGKFSEAKGLPWLLDAFKILQKKQPKLHLHLAGSGTGPEAERLMQHMASMDSCITIHGMLDQTQLAQIMGRCSVTVLPSFYEGVPLVLAEAAACGCRIVSTQLHGVQEQLAPALGNSLHIIPLPRLLGIDKPDPADLPDFVQNIIQGLDAALRNPTIPHDDLDALTWGNVFRKMKKIWEESLASTE